MCAWWGGGRQASYNRAIVLGLFSGEISLSGGQQPQGLSFSLLPRPPERQAQDHLGKGQNELCSYLQDMPEDPPNSRNAQTPAQGSPTPISTKERSYVLVTAEPSILRVSREGICAVSARVNENE